MKGTDESLARDRARIADDYRCAKNQGDHDAAMRLVIACVNQSPNAIDQLIDRVIPLVQMGKRIIIAVPHPPFDDAEADGADLVGHKLVRNAIPVAFAAWLSDTLGAEIAFDIVQSARVGRTKLNRFLRFLCQPAFDGAVDTKATYILADDVFTMGGTLAALRSHIIGNGGEVAAITALTHKTGKSQLLAISAKTWDELNSQFGPSLDMFWRKEIGHASDCLTEAEGRLLVRWSREEGDGRSGDALLQRLRDRLAAAAAKGE